MNILILEWEKFLGFNFFQSDITKMKKKKKNTEKDLSKEITFYNFVEVYAGINRTFLCIVLV